jgi:hypothetical protein
MSPTDQQMKITCKVCGAEFYPDKWQIDKKKLLLAEGVDAHRFLIYACGAYGKPDVQVINFGGINELNLFLKTLVELGDFSKVEILVVARDAETSVASAIDSVKGALENVSLPTPTQPFEWCSNESIKTAFMLFPGLNEAGQCQTGTLEHLCLQTVATDPLLNCVEDFVQCAQENQQNNDRISHPWKCKLYAYLAGKDDNAGKRLSQAAKDKVWNLNHPAMTPFKKIIQEM